MTKWKIQIPKTSKRTENDRQIHVKFNDNQPLVFILNKDQYDFTFELDSSYDWVYNKRIENTKTFEVFLVAQNTKKSHQETKNLVPELKT